MLTASGTDAGAQALISKGFLTGERVSQKRELGQVSYYHTETLAVDGTTCMPFPIPPPATGPPDEMKVKNPNVTFRNFSLRGSFSGTNVNGGVICRMTIFRWKITANPSAYDIFGPIVTPRDLITFPPYLPNSEYYEILVDETYVNPTSCLLNVGGTPQYDASDSLFKHSIDTNFNHIIDTSGSRTHQYPVFVCVSMLGGVSNLEMTLTTQFEM